MDPESKSPPDKNHAPSESTPLIGGREHPGHRLNHFVGPRSRGSTQISVMGGSQLESAVTAIAADRLSESKGFKWKFAVILAASQILLLGLFLKFVRYSFEIDASRDPQNSVPFRNRTNDTLYPIYPLFQDDTMLIFFGISYLYFFMKKYGFTSAGYNFFICCLGIEISLLFQGLLNNVFVLDKPLGFIEVDVRAVLTAEFSAVTIPIALGCVLGKIGPVQLLVFSLIEILGFNLNQMVGVNYLRISDAGGSVFLHAFACYYGMAACAVLYNPEQETSKNLSVSHTTDLFSIGGTLMLWCLWPSFNSALLLGDQQHRAIVNTFLSLVGSCLATFSSSSFLSLKGKFNMTHIQNATLAGGVAIGTCCNLMVGPGGALVIGTIAGFVCTMGMNYGTPWLARVLKIHDVSSVHNLHGLPAVVAVVASSFMVIWATRDFYQDSLYTIYPAMAPPTKGGLTPAALALGVRPGKGWTRSFQAMMQLIGFFMTFFVALAGGTLAGRLMKLRWLDEPSARQLYTDDAFWEPKPGKVFIFDGSVATAPSPNSIRKGLSVPPSASGHAHQLHSDSFAFTLSQHQRFVHLGGDYAVNHVTGGGVLVQGGHPIPGGVLVHAGPPIPAGSQVHGGGYHTPDLSDIEENAVDDGEENSPSIP